MGERFRRPSNCATPASHCGSLAKTTGRPPSAPASRMRDPEYSPFTGTRPGEPRLDLVETCWRATSATGIVFSCGVYQTDAGLELRVGYGPDDLIRSQF